MPAVSSILNDLNKSQRKAVTHKAAPLLVLAGAGSGKTRVLTYRVAHFIEQGMDPASILAMTFTNKAARVMQGRIEALTHTHTAVAVGTFHKIGLDILRSQSGRLGATSAFTVYDELDQRAIVKECMSDLNISTQQMSPRGVVESIQRAKDDLKSPELYGRAASDRYEVLVSRIYRNYQEMLARLGGLDFGDIIMRTVSLFDEHPDVRNAYEDRYRHIFVDEYQDTNRAQYRFIKMLAGRHRSITVVGDPDQSIYAWRGADLNNILDFERDFAGADVIALEQNYRSTTHILDGANALIGHNRKRKEKNLWSERGEGEPIHLDVLDDEKQEARSVVERIMGLQREGRRLEEMVVFYRVHAQSRVFEDILRRENIMYKIIGGVRFYDRREIKDLIAYLRLVRNPLDDVSFLRIINVPARGLGKKTLERLRTAAEASRKSLYESLAAASLGKQIGARAEKSLRDFYRFIEEMRKQSESVPVAKLAEQIMRSSGYIRYLDGDRSIEARMRAENIEEFFTVMQEFDESYVPRSPDDSRLDAFLEEITLSSAVDQWGEPADTLTLMTLHAAKGLEFPVVFMVGMEEGLFPHSFSGIGTCRDMEEERRLCYVGMTRAKDLLCMSYARSRATYGARLHPEPSRFLLELPADCVLMNDEGGLARSEGAILDEELDRALAMEARSRQASYDAVDVTLSDEDEVF